MFSEILKILLRDEVLGEDVDLSVLAKQTESFSGSDLKRSSFSFCLVAQLSRIIDLCVSAALDAIKEDIKLPWLVSSSDQNISDTTAPGEKSTDAQPVETKPEDLETSPKPLKGQQSEEVADKSKEVETSSSTPEPQEGESATPPLAHERTLSRRHFDKALKEITPSSSESLGSLADLRKWNEEFGEGRKDRKRKSIWGRGRFGFTDKDVLSGEEGRVVATPSSEDTSSRV